MARCGQQSQESISSFSLAISELLRLKVRHVLALLFLFYNLANGMIGAPYSFGSLLLSIHIISNCIHHSLCSCDFVISHACPYIQKNLREFNTNGLKFLFAAFQAAGNEAFQSGKYLEAVEYYTTALLSNSESLRFLAVCFCNRAAAYQAMDQILDAIADCSLAIALDADYAKVGVLCIILLYLLKMPHITMFCNSFWTITKTTCIYCAMMPSHFIMWQFLAIACSDA
jgi:tetratricopeptide (TPR) repeat protein